jgi:hypothetical protein
MQLHKVFTDNGFKPTNSSIPHITIGKTSLVKHKVTYPSQLCDTVAKRDFFLNFPIELTTVDLCRINTHITDDDGYYHTEESRSRKFNIVNA